MINFFFSAYGGIDWFADMFFVSRAFARGYRNYGAIGFFVIVVNAVVNAIVMAKIIAKER